MLGNDLRIRRFTPQAEKLLNLIPADVGRPISDFRLKITVPDLVSLCQVVIGSTSVSAKNWVSQNLAPTSCVRGNPSSLLTNGLESTISPLAASATSP